MKRPVEIAYEYIKERILDGVYLPSQKLVENNLADEIGVSRNTVKKALLKLEQENLILLENNKGATIKSFSLEEIINLLKIREVLEGLIAADAALHISDEALLKLEQILGEMKQNLDQVNYDAYSLGNIQFHNIIYDACKNVQAVEMVKIIKQQLKRLHFKTILVPGRNESSYEEHLKILTALKLRDADVAEKQIKKHVANVLNTIVENYRVLV
jgi:DNA-binding GntR family transcriptional regulator